MSNVPDKHVGSRIQSKAAILLDWSTSWPAKADAACSPLNGTCGVLCVRPCVDHTDQHTQRLLHVTITLLHMSPSLLWRCCVCV